MLFEFLETLLEFINKKDFISSTTNCSWDCLKVPNLHSSLTCWINGANKSSSKKTGPNSWYAISNNVINFFASNSLIASIEPSKCSITEPVLGRFAAEVWTTVADSSDSTKSCKFFKFNLATSPILLPPLVILWSSISFLTSLSEYNLLPLTPRVGLTALYLRSHALITSELKPVLLDTICIGCFCSLIFNL